MNQSPEFEARAQQALPGLSPKLQKALQYLVTHRDDIALSSMRSIAATCDVTPPTMLRLARKLGYSDWNTLRDEIQTNLRGRSDGPLTARARDLVARKASSHPQAIAQDMMLADESNLRRSWEQIPLDGMEAAVTAILAARNVYFLGRRSCYPVAFALYYTYRMIRRNSVLVSDNGAGIVNALADLAPEDMLIVVGFAPYSRETVSLTQYAARKNATILAITDSAISPLAMDAQHVFIASNTSPALFHSTIAAQSIGQALIAMVTATEGQRAVDALEAREAQLRELGAYWPDDSKPAPKRQKKPNQQGRLT